MSATKTEVRPFLQRLPEKISFFRPEELEEVKNRLKYSNFLAVFGEESYQLRSLVFDGLLPSLQTNGGGNPAAGSGGVRKSDIEGRAGFNWSIAPILTPGPNPVGNLAGALAEPGVLRAAVEADFGKTLERKLRSGIDGLLEVYESEKDSEDFNLLIVVDRLEEISMFRENGTWHGQAGDDALFFNLILSAIRSSLPVYIILLMDSGSLNQVYQYSGFLEDIDQNRFQLRKFDPKSAAAWVRQAAGDGAETEAERAFIDALAADLKNGNNGADPHALFKLTFALQQMRAAAAGSQDADISQLYRENGKISRVIDLWLERKFGALQPSGEAAGETPAGLASLTTDQKIVMRSFKALTEKDPSGVAVRRPVFLSELLELCRRSVANPANAVQSNADPWGDETTKNLTERQVLDQLMGFNTPSNPFIRIIDPPADQDFDRIVYIQEEALVSNWNRIKAWADQEVVDAGIYKGLIEFAKAYYKKTAEGVPGGVQAGPTGNTPETGLLKRIWEFIAGYFRMISGSVKRELQLLNKKIEFSLQEDFNPGEKLSLNSIRLPFEWKQNNIPNETWARRYYNPHRIPVKDPPPEDPDALEEYKLNKYLVQEKGIEHHFALARTYYDLSLENVKGIVERREMEKERRVNNSRRLTLIFLVLAVVAVIATIRASSLRRAEKLNRQNVELFDFLDILSQTRTIRKEIHSEEYNNKLKEEIRTESLLDEDEMKDSMRGMLKFLADSFYIALIPDAMVAANRNLSAYNERVIDKFNTLSINAALTLNSLKVAENARNSKSLIIQSASDILGIAGEAINFNRTVRDTFYQFPLIYKALEEHIATLQQILAQKYDDLEHNNFRHKDQALVMAFASNPGIEAQYAYGDALGNVRIFNGEDDFKTASSGERITALTYTDSATLLAGTFRGNILRYEGLATDPRGKGVFPYAKLELGPDMDKPINAIFQIGDYLLVVTPWELQLLSASTGGPDRFVQVQNVRLDAGLHEIRACAISPDKDMVIAGGDGALEVFELSEGPNRSLVHLKTVPFTGAAITALAVSDAFSGPFGEQTSLVAVGLENGTIFLAPADDLLPDANFGADLGILSLQSSTISTLGFNPHAHQLASSSLDGSIVLWNLDLIAPGNVQGAVFLNDYDHIRLEESGQGMWGIVYINSNELFSTENLTIRKWKTNIEVLKKELEELLGEYKNDKDY
ncbi:MAG: hypothetical protein H6562_04650 [Lewinellaceae bacterium]|nr:hypothetical protein [Lewinella sp.]MCB9278178.1 hypothetical protein [Lewinellaceae bacterium]